MLLAENRFYEQSVSVYDVMVIDCCYVPRRAKLVCVHAQSTITVSDMQLNRGELKFDHQIRRVIRVPAGFELCLGQWLDSRVILSKKRASMFGNTSLNKAELMELDLDSGAQKKTGSWVL